ncbi:hypothetical protein [Leptospira weilii]|nr:hypothetical protein [Leptospira weilii]
MLDELKNKLLKSESYKSLVQEKTIADLLKNLKWNVSHGVYYPDPTINKKRELDIFCQRYFLSENASSTINLLIEVKSLSDYHLLFPPYVNRYSVSFNNIAWKGEYAPNYQPYTDVLLRHGLSKRDVTRFINKLNNLHFYNNGEESHILDLHIRPFPIDISSTFRETNSKIERGLESAVVWKAFQSLQSASEGIKKNLLEIDLKEFERNILTHQLGIYGLDKDEDVIQYLAKYNHDSGLASLNVYHPILIIESTLWKVSSNNDLKEISWIRLYEEKADPYFGFWIDIVNAKFVDEYFNMLNDYYNSEIKDMKGQIFP